MFAQSFLTGLNFPTHTLTTAASLMFALPGIGEAQAEYSEWIASDIGHGYGLNIQYRLELDPKKLHVQIENIGTERARVLISLKLLVDNTPMWNFGDGPIPGIEEEIIRDTYVVEDSKIVTDAYARVVRVLGISILSYDSESIKSDNVHYRNEVLAELASSITRSFDYDFVQWADQIMEGLFERAEAEAILAHAKIAADEWEAEYAPAYQQAVELGNTRGTQWYAEKVDTIRGWITGWERRLGEFDNRPPRRRMSGASSDTALQYDGPRVIEFGNNHTSSTDARVAPEQLTPFEELMSIINNGEFSLEEVNSDHLTNTEAPTNPTAVQSIEFSSRPFESLGNLLALDTSKPENRETYGLDDFSLNNLFGPSDPTSGDRPLVNQELLTLGQSLFQQGLSGDGIDLREASNQRLKDVIADTAWGSIDETMQRLISALPESPQFDVKAYYDTFVNPNTAMVTPWQAYQNVDKYFNSMVGDNLYKYFGFGNESD